MVTATINATINGEPRELVARTTLGGLLRELGIPAEGIAVAVNARVVRRAELEGHELGEGDAVEIIRAVAGG
jgi:thiamine biosynthesis protein ThiS